MVKIISSRSLGKQAVYDIGVAQDHNFILHNGLVASNCFNKSHSTAYGYVTYQTAYLKANYPVEYMAALLTANSDGQNKVQSYIASCNRMGITVEPPDINRSQVDFTPLQDRILFGLSAVRNVGQGAIECILEARQQGPFKSLADLCDRVDNRAVNRRALEALIQSGAFDSLETNRRQMIEDLPLILEWAQSRARDKASGQGNLLDLLNDTPEQDSSLGFESAPKAAPVEDYPAQEKLKLEKELLGFYISDHPLKTIQKSAQLLAPINLSDLANQRGDMTVSAIVMLTSIKPVITKKGDRMAIVQIEDLTGQTEAVIFPKSFERISAHIVTDARLMVWGKVERRDEQQVQFIIDDVEPIEEINLVMVELAPKVAGDIEYQHTLRNILLQNRGDEVKAKTPVVAIVTDHQNRQLIRLGSQFQVQDHQAAVSALQQAGFQARATSLTGG